MRSHTAIQMGVGALLLAGAASLAVAAEPTGDHKDMVLIPKDEFTRGSNEHSDEVRHQVVLDAYLIDKFEASNARYKEFMRATGHPAPAYWDDPRLSKSEQPVVGVSWTDANAFCKWAGKRLLRMGQEAAADRSRMGEGCTRHRRPDLSLGERRGGDDAGELRPRVGRGEDAVCGGFVARRRLTLWHQGHVRQRPRMGAGLV